MGSYRLAGCLLYITWTFVPLDLILPVSVSNPACGDQPNRAVRTRMLRGVGAVRLLPIPIFFLLFITLEATVFLYGLKVLIIVKEWNVVFYSD